MTEDGTVLENVGAVGYAEAALKNFQVHSLSLHSMLSEAIHTGQLVWVRSHAEYTARYPHLASTRAATQREASAVAPLLLENQVLGVIMFSFIEVHDFSPEEKDFVVALTSLCAQALERARLYEVEQRARAEAEANQQRLVLLAEMHERNRLGQELHDTVAQALGYLNLKLSMMNNMLADHQFDLIAADLPELKKVVSETYTDVREEIFNLRAKALSAMSFMELLQRYIDKYHRFYNLDIQLIQEIDPALFEFPAEISSQLIRTIQEALINIRKHSHVSTANIRLGCRKDGQLCIVIEDQGQGFDMAKVKEKTSSFGLQIMRERVEGVGGSLEVETSPGKGTRVILCYRPKNQDLNSLAGSDCNKR
jgi:signal transduction histidine kinase